MLHVVIIVTRGRFVKNLADSGTKQKTTYSCHDAVIRVHAAHTMQIVPYIV